MKKADFILNIFLVPLDFCLVFLAALTAYYFRFSEAISTIRPVVFDLSFDHYLQLAFNVSILSIFVFALAGFYAMRSKRLIKEIPRIFFGVSMVVVFLVLFIFLTRELFSSRFIILLGWALAILYLFIGRVIVFLLRDRFFSLGFGLSSIFVLGDINARQIIVNTYKHNPRLGFKVVGEFDDLAQLENDATAKNLLSAKKVDYLMQTDSALAKDQALDLLTFCQENHLSLKYIANLFQAQSLHVNFSEIAGYPLVEIAGTPLDGWRKVYKRIFDFILALFLLIILSPIFLILAILVKTTSEGPIFVSLKRVGEKGKIFNLYKFRSMINGAHSLKSEMLAHNERKDGPLFKMKNDPRVTKFGKFLRTSSLDEFPQLFNVLRGTMSLVGPRPHEPEEVSNYQRGYKRLLSIKPGMTGLAQVSGRSNLLFAEEAKLDIFYIENWSILLDIIILLKTPWVVLKKDAC